ncbi:hypothetical protein BWQ96_05261 [Gracilariopsis chorda]|uniref:Ig-like domain-containing protein n=1 Tax=Gracilariopsis chorda TaxID=448386 RepID=A0A2V3IS65_9FLOR|nr:hypothetical protein BWQ96_05261 [Gracilariopsis chorda]|eukprot:PXF44961.1 hypothetical protein BWQ96_05261 [Gracilariopsis chorda]
MTSLNQYCFVSGTKTYKFGYNSVPNVTVTSAPDDADFTRSAMLYDGQTYRFYCFKSTTKDTIYQFAWSGSSYVWGAKGSIPELTITGLPDDADLSQFGMLHDSGKYRLYVKKLGSASIYQCAWDGSSYAFGASGAIPEMAVVGFPADADLTRWDMLHDGSDYRFYCLSAIDGTKVYQGAFKYGEGYKYAHNSIPTLSMTESPPTSTCTSICMLHDGRNYRLYTPSS